MKYKNGIAEIYSFIGPSGVNEKRQSTFGEHANIRYLVWHEFSHSVVNPLTEKYIEEGNQNEMLFRPLDRGTFKISYGSWFGMLTNLLIGQSLFTWNLSNRGKP